jgi:ubiquinone/menaquinone biosynthesis C-methylase UbiE
MDIDKNISSWEHWQKVYNTKAEKELSWFQEYPVASMKLIDSFNLDVNSRIIDVGSGDGRFIEALLERGYRDITALDISEAAIKRAVKRLGEKSAAIKWITSDILYFEPITLYDLWHDRATFHFLINEVDINRYISIAENAIKPNGYLIISTFSEQGPKRCSGLDIMQYSELSLTKKLERAFEKVKCLTEDHITPGGTVQNFLFCGFKKKGTI